MEVRGAVSLGVDRRLAKLVHQGSDPTLPYQTLANRESAMLRKGFAPWGQKAFVGSRATGAAYVGSFSPDGFDSTLPTPRRSNTKAMSSLRGCGPVLPRVRVARHVSSSLAASSARSFLGI